MEEKDYKVTQRFYELKYKNRGKVVFGQEPLTKEDYISGKRPKGKIYINSDKVMKKVLKERCKNK